MEEYIVSQLENDGFGLEEIFQALEISKDYSFLFEYLTEKKGKSLSTQSIIPHIDKPIEVPSKIGKKPLAVFNFAEDIFGQIPKSSQVDKGKVPFKANKKPLEVFNFDNLVKNPVKSEQDKEMPILKNEIKSQLLEIGIPPDQAELAAENCNSVDDALSFIAEFFGNSPEIFGNSSEFHEEEKKNFENDQHPYWRIEKFHKEFAKPSPFQMPDLKMLNFDPSNWSENKNHVGKPKKIKEGKESYRKVMKNLIVLNLFGKSAFEDFTFQDPQKLNMKALKRLEADLEKLRKNAPCSQDSALFIGLKNGNSALAKLIITGRPASPFAYGLYVFEILIPHNFPEFAPKIVMNTGMGKVLTRINESNQLEIIEKDPRDGTEIYKKNVHWSDKVLENGILALGILNTLDEDPDKWRPAKSDLTQVFVKISEGIMRDNCKVKHNSNGKIAEKNLIEVWEDLEIRYANIKYAVIGMIEKNPIQQEMVCILHFKLVYDSAQKKFKEWLDEIRDLDQNPPKNYISKNPEIFQLLKHKTPFKAFEELIAEFSELNRKQ